MAHLCDLIAHVFDVALAELPDVVGAPALGVAVRGQHARVIATERHDGGGVGSRDRELVQQPKAACIGLP